MTFKELFKKVDEMNNMLSCAKYYNDIYNVYIKFGDVTNPRTFKSYEEFKTFVNYQYIPVISKQIIKNDVTIGGYYSIWWDDECGKYITIFAVDIIKV